MQTVLLETAGTVTVRLRNNTFAASDNAHNTRRSVDEGRNRETAHPRLDPRIQRLVTAIEANPHQRLSLTAMAQIAGLSPSRLRHKFKAVIGITPTHYLQKVRLRMAADLLKDENVSVKEVRAAIGLESDSYFTHLCKRVYGRPPSRLRDF